MKLKLEPEGKFYFSATAGAGKVPYEIDFDLYDKVDVEVRAATPMMILLILYFFLFSSNCCVNLSFQESKASVGSRNICYLVKKAENKWWDRLLKQGGKAPVFLKVDWDKWVDEDEEQDNKCE